MVLIKKIMKYVFIIAIVSYVCVNMFNINTGLIQSTKVGTITQWRFNLKDYLQAQQENFFQPFIALEEIVPKGTWQNPTGTIVQSQFWSAVLNNMQLIYNWAVFPLNFLLWIIRFIVSMVKFLLGIVGWPTTQTNGTYDSKLIEILSWIQNKLAIPYTYQMA